MRRVMVALLLVFLCVIPVSAQTSTEEFGAEDLHDGLSGQAKAWMEEYDPLESIDLVDGIATIFDRTFRSGLSFLRSAVTTCIKLLLILVFCKLAELWEEKQEICVGVLIGVIAISACCMGDLSAMIGLGKKTMDDLSVFASVLMPVMASACAASGSINGAGMIYSLTVLFSNILIQVSNSLLFPLIYAFLALAMGDAVLQRERLKRLRELLGWIIKLLLKLTVSLYTGFLAVTGILSGATDAAALKAAKFAISGMVPVVGGIISNAADTILSGASVVKTAVGSFGMLAIFAVFALPFLQIGIYYVMMKVASALGGIMESKLCGMLEAVSAAMGFVLAMTAGCVFINLLSCCCYIRTVYV